MSDTAQANNVGMTGFLELRDQLEKDLQADIAERLNTFRERTGVTPSDIDVSMVWAQTLSHEKPWYKLGNVTVGFDL